MALEEDWVFVPLAETRVIQQPKDPCRRSSCSDREEVYACARCKAHVTTEGSVVSKDFVTQNGRGYLVSSVANVTNGPGNERLLMTGVHVTEDLSCVSCGAVVGWEYKDASDPSQKYKIGKFVVDLVKLEKCDWEWDQDM